MSQAIMYSDGDVSVGEAGVLPYRPGIYSALPLLGPNRRGSCKRSHLILDGARGEWAQTVTHVKLCLSPSWEKGGSLGQGWDLS